MNIERFVDELFSLIAVERNRRILARCADGPKTLEVLSKSVGDPVAGRPKDKRYRTLEKDVNRMRVLGLLDGTRDTGWTLVASEVHDLIAAVRHARDNLNVFDALANQTVRAVLAAMLGPEKTRTELRVCGDTADISNAIGRLTDLGVIEMIQRQPQNLAQTRSCWPLDGSAGACQSARARAAGRIGEARCTPGSACLVRARSRERGSSRGSPFATDGYGPTHPHADLRRQR